MITRRSRGSVYAASPMPASGESQMIVSKRFPGGDFAASVNLTTTTLPDGTSGTYASQGRQIRRLLAADVPESVLALMIAPSVHRRCSPRREADFGRMDEQAELASQASEGSRLSIEEWKFESRSRHAHVIEVSSSHAVPARIRTSWST